MCKIQNVARTDGLYYYRRLIRLGRDKPFRLRFSLRTTSRRRAALLAPALTLIAERLAMTMMASIVAEGLTAAQRAEIYRRQMLVERDRLEAMHASLHFLPRDDHHEVGKALSLRLGASEMAAQDGAIGGDVDDFLVAHIDPDDDDADVLVLAWSDIAASIAEESPEAAASARLAEIGIEETQLRTALARKVVNQARLTAIGEFRQALIDPAAAYRPVPLEGYGVGTTAAAAAPPPPSATSDAGLWASMTAPEAVEKFFAHNPRTGGSDGSDSKPGEEPWTDKTREQFRLPAQFLHEVMEGRPLSQVTHDDLVRLNQCFAKVHGKTFRKSKRQRAMTILQIVIEYEAQVARDAEEAERLAKQRSRGIDPEGQPEFLTIGDLGLNPATTNRHWGFLRQLTKWFSDHQPLAKLDYGAFIVNDKRNQRSLREVYTKQQGEEIFSLAPWTGSKSHARRMQPGDLVVHDAWYFVPLIAWYSGMRRDEICGMKLADIEQSDGLWLFYVRDNDARRIKTVASQRKLPFAQELVRLGLPNYVEAMRAAGETRLFPEMVAESGKGTMGDAFYKKVWTKIAAAHPFLGNGQGLHAFRHTAIDSLKAAKISEAVAADFAGHAIEGETGGRYSKAHIHLLQEAVDAIPEVTRHLDARPVNLLPARLRAPRKARPARD